MNLNIYTDLSLHCDHVPADVRTPLRASLDCDFKHKIKCTVESIRCDQKTKTKKKPTDKFKVEETMNMTLKAEKCWINGHSQSVMDSKHQGLISPFSRV